ncbi:MAG: helix-turn-helix transcriptional regulator [Lachnospiraceae bacterium]|nr:helix-turn-helix transcriptional regulator [Lachnospiraceae bacterium]
MAAVETMQKGFLAERITKLRLGRGVSEAKMSTDLGRGRSYINRITTGRGFPGYPELLLICRYFEMSPEDFFCSDDLSDGDRTLFHKLKRLTKREQDMIEEVVDRLLAASGKKADE